ncbi:uncharacterized protein METZ01_LOCUS439290, partial [marine metagenome]
MTKMPFIRFMPLAAAAMLSISAPLGQALTLFNYEADWKLWRGQKTPS